MPISFVPAILPSRSQRVTTTAELNRTKPAPPLIPQGATLEPVLRENSITRRLENLTFGYENNAYKCLRYRCRHGHVITSRPGTPACRSCPVCSAEGSLPCMNTTRCMLTLCELGAVARDRGGSMLSTQYQNARTPLTWRCARGYVWHATASNLRSANSWCPECARQKRKATIDDLRSIAEALGGECLSSQLYL